MSDKILELKNLSKSYDKLIFENVNLTVAKKDYIAIIGASGSGKSTLMNILGLLEKYDSGEYFFQNQILDFKKDLSKIRLHQIGYIFQSYNLIEDMNAIDNILLPTIYCKTDISHVDEIINLLDISDLKTKNVNLLSGGEKQRVAIARSLILNPNLILADEPTGNLDTTNRDIVLDIFDKIIESGKAIIIITHDLDVAKRAKITYKLIDNKLVLL